MTSDNMFKQTTIAKENKVGAFCLSLNVVRMVDESTVSVNENYYIVKEFQIYEGDCSFYTYCLDSKEKNAFNTNDSDYPIKKLEEDMLDYFDRIYNEIKGNWLWMSIFTEYLFMRGRFE